MSEPMNMQQTGDLLKLILNEHSMLSCKRGARIVKYVDPHFDMRTGHCFSLTLRGYGWEEHFHTQNECSDLPQSLYDRVIAFLNKVNTPTKDET